MLFFHGLCYGLLITLSWWLSIWYDMIWYDVQIVVPPYSSWVRLCPVLKWSLQKFICPPPEILKVTTMGFFYACRGTLGASVNRSFKRTEKVWASLNGFEAPGPLEPSCWPQNQLIIFSYFAFLLYPWSIAFLFPWSYFVVSDCDRLLCSHYTHLQTI